jgi:hypothetical protein
MCIVFFLNGIICLRTLSLSGEIKEFEHELEKRFERKKNDDYIPDNPKGSDYVKMNPEEDDEHKNTYFPILYDAINQEKFPCRGGKLNDQVKGYLEGNVVLSNLLKIGVIMTTFTGLLPALAYDDPAENRLSVILNVLHVAGLGVGIIIILIALTIRIICRFSSDCCREKKSEEPKSDFVLFNRIEYILDFFLLIFNLVVLFRFLLNNPDTIPQSWFCTTYSNSIECTAADRNLTSYLLPWPCVWDQKMRVECTNPNCPWEFNAESVVVEYFMLSYAVLLLASYLSSITGALSPSNNRHQHHCSCS